MEWNLWYFLSLLADTDIHWYVYTDEGGWSRSRTGTY